MFEHRITFFFHDDVDFKKPYIRYMTQQECLLALSVASTIDTKWSKHFQFSLFGEAHGAGNA